MRIRLACAVVAVVMAAASAQAATIVFNGYLNDPANDRLVGSDLGPALFADDYEVANNVALYDLTVPFAGTVTFTSKGYAVGGADPYFTLFAGGGGSATVAGSNYDQAFSTGGDFSLPFSLAAGSYQVAIGVFANMSYAENLGVGALADGFTGLGGPDYLRSSYYELEVTLPGGEPPEVPEPATILLLGSCLAGLTAVRRRLPRR